jgi:tetraacyldisaccharide-1-P 4'-kinase
VFIVTGIARPDRFIADIVSAGWDVSGTITFRDHHRFSRRDVKRIAADAKAAASAIVLTTEKDAVRLTACELGDLPIAAVPLVVGVDPPDGFRDWLLEQIGQYDNVAGATSDARPAPQGVAGADPGRSESR